MDVATLGLAVDSRQVENGSKALNDLTNSAMKAEAAANGVSSGTKNASTAAAAMTANASNAARALDMESRSAQNATRSIIAHGSAAKTAALNVGNLAAQFQDIGVTLAMGMSPLQIALQQGTQMAAVMGPMGAAGAVRALGAAFISIFSPMSLLTIGLVTAGAAAAQYFFGIETSGSGANDVIEKQSQLIGKVANDWDQATPRLKAYADELERVRKANDLRSAGEVAAKAETTKVEDVLGLINQQYTSAIRNLRTYGDEGSAVANSLASAFGDLQVKISDGTATTKDLVDAQNAMASAVNTFGIPSVIELRAVFDELVPSINAAIAAAGGFRAEVSAALSQQMFAKNLGNSTLPSLDPLGFINADRDQTARANATKSQTQIAAEAAARLAARASRSGGGVSEIERQKEAVTDLISQLEYEQSIVGKSAQEQAKMNAIRRAGGAATEEQKKKIEDIIDATYREKEAIENAKEALEDAKSATKGFLSDLRSGLMDGKSFWESFGNAAMNVLDKIISKVEDELVDALFAASGTSSSSSGGFLGMLFGGIGKLFGFASGGYTGARSASAVAGVVHGGEYVFSKRATDRIGVGNLEAMHRSAKGYASGGYVAPMPANQNGSGSRNDVLHVNVGLKRDAALNIMPDVEVVAERKVASAAPQIVKAASSRVVPTMSQYQMQKQGRDYRLA
ncbi:phage tail length tape measure family protein [Rhizobium alvei]